MLTNSYYFRDEDFTYPIQGHPEYWFYTGKSQNRQALIGLLGNCLTAVIFDSGGNCLGVPEPLTSVPGSVQMSPGKGLSEEQLRVQVEKQIDLYRDQMGFENAGIQVKRFAFPTHKIGVEDLPDDLQEFLLNPRRFSNADRADLEDTLEGWKEEDLFVFWWGQSFTMDMQGCVTSS